MARDLSKGPTNSYWGFQLNQFLDGGVLDDVKQLDILCYSDTDARNAALSFRAFKKRYNLPIDISKSGDSVRLTHLEREGDIHYATVMDGRKVS